MIRETLSNSETYIMKVIWSSGEDISVMDLVEELRERYEKDYQRSTIATFLVRLSSKGFVSTYKRKKYAYVHAEVSEADYKAYIARNETDFWFSGRASEYFAALCSSKEISKDEIERIRGMLDGMDD